MHMPMRPVQNNGVPDIAAAAAAAQSAAERARAAETRRRLLKSAAELSSASTPEEEFLIGHWLEASENIALPGDEYRSSGERDEHF